MLLSQSGYPFALVVAALLLIALFCQGHCILEGFAVVDIAGTARGHRVFSVRWVIHCHFEWKDFGYHGYSFHGSCQ